MASIERFIRAAQNPEKAAPKTTPAEKPTGGTGAKIGRAGKAVVKPVAQTPFDKSTDEKASAGYDGRNVLLDVSTMSAVFLNTSANLGRVVLRCSDRQADGRRIIEARILAKVTGTGLTTPFTNTNGSVTQLNRIRALVCQAEHGDLGASIMPALSTNGSGSLGNYVTVRYPLTPLQSAEWDVISVAYAAIDPLQKSFVFGMGPYISVNTGAVLAAKVLYIEELDTWHFVEWEWSSAALVN